MCMSGADKLVSAMVKGAKKRRSSANFGFKPGHQMNTGRVQQDSGIEQKPTKYLRLEKDLHDLVVNSPHGEVAAEDSQGRTVNVSYLRPRPSRPSALELAAASVNIENEKKTMRQLQLIEVERMWNCAFEEHKRHAPDCDMYLVFDMESNEIH